MKCSLCRKETRSLYGLPGDHKALMCADCFFGRSQPKLPEVRAVYERRVAD